MGVPASGAATVRVRVTPWLWTEEGVEEVKVAVGVAFATISPEAAEVLVANVPSPSKRAVIEFETTGSSAVV